MQKFLDYISNPSTWIAFCVFLFGLGATYATLNNRISAVENKIDSIDIVSIQTQLASIQSDISWIKMTLQSK